MEARERLGHGDVNWAIGVVLYWGEGAKIKPWGGHRKLAFTNMDPQMLRLFREWLLNHAAVNPADIVYDLYIHRDADIRRARTHWARLLEIGETRIRVYFKPPNPLTRRKRVGNVYYGVMRLGVRRSTLLLHRIEGWIQGIVEYCGVG